MMFSVFSDTSMKMSDKIRELQSCAGASYNRMLIAGSNDEPLYMLKNNATLAWLKFINERILFELPKIKTLTDVQWIWVRIRIATNWLNKFENYGYIPKNVCIEYHTRLTSRIRKVIGEIYTEDLPF